MSPAVYGRMGGYRPTSAFEDDLRDVFVMRLRGEIYTVSPAESW